METLSDGSRSDGLRVDDWRTVFLIPSNPDKVGLRMMESEELANLYDQTAYCLENLRGIFVTLDAVLRTLLEDENLRPSLEAKLKQPPTQMLNNTIELLRRLDLTLAATRVKSSHFRQSQ